MLRKMRNNYRLDNPSIGWKIVILYDISNNMQWLRLIFMYVALKLHLPIL